MKPTDRIVQGPDGTAALLRRATTPHEVGRALADGVIVEVDFDIAAACGADRDDNIDAAEAFAAAEDPADFFDEGGHGPQ